MADSAPTRCGVAILSLLLLAPAGRLVAQEQMGGFTIDQVRSYPFPEHLTAAPAGHRIAWTFNQEGRRNIWVAEGPDWVARQITPYDQDDGQELTSVHFTPDGNTIVYVRGGDHGANWQEVPPNPTSNTVEPKIQIWAVPFAGGTPRMLADGDDPAVSPRGAVVAFVRSGQIFTVPVDGSAPAQRLFYARGSNRSPEWSPDGSRLAFVSSRGDHSFIGVYNTPDQPVRWLAPTTSRDNLPRWSPDGRRIAYIRMPGSGGPPRTLLALHPNPWAIWTADATTGEGRRVWQSPNTLWGSFPTTQGNANLHWAAGDRIVFLADLDGWPHLYSIPAGGGEPLLLTPGRFMCEYISLSPDGRTLLYAANAGVQPADIDRRHVFRVPVDRANPVAINAGSDLGWTPVFTGDLKSIAYIGADPQRPPLPMVVDAAGGRPRTLAQDQIPSDFPTNELVEPRMVVFKAADGLEIHGQLFERPGGPEHKPAVIFVHGGPPRQMLLGWHYSYYYSNAYAMNQWFANHGYIAMTVNYRLGIGYGHDFHHPPDAGARGAAEYRDVRAAGEYLRSLPNVDPQHIGIWGGSYGGFLTALALGKDSGLFAAGVDMHGVHDFTADGGRRVGMGAWRYEKNDAQQAAQVGWDSSPVAYVSTWRSPVLLIQGDDDRNVRFHQTVDLYQRLSHTGVHTEELVFPDEIHDFLLHRSWINADKATADFFGRMFGMSR